MTHKKGKFLNFCFSCIPGAGQMYQGFMKRGLSIMVIFFGMLAVISYLGIDELIFCLPVIWFYGFFDGIHLNSLPDSQYSQVKDEFLFADEDFSKIRLKGFRIPAAVALILFGSYSMFRTVIHMLIWQELLFWDSPITGLVYDLLPKMLFSALIIFLGVYLIVGKKREIEVADFEEEAFNHIDGYPPMEFQTDEESDDFAEGNAWESPAEEFPESVLIAEKNDGETEGGEE